MEKQEFFKKLKTRNTEYPLLLPKKELVYLFINRFKAFLFPDCMCSELNDHAELEWEKLKLLLYEVLNPMKNEIEDNISNIVDNYFNEIPFVYEKLIKDAEAINKFDPASYSVNEILLAYPGFQAIMVYRLAHLLYKMNIPIIPRIMSEYAHMQTGIDINPGAKIGESFFIDHGTGIVIGETCLIGNNVKIYQGVTLGALSVKKEEAKLKRHPTIENNVIIYSGTTILGGDTVIGHNSVVGGNVWLTKSIEPYSIVHNISEIKVRAGQKRETQEINFSI